MKRKVVIAGLLCFCMLAQVPAPKKAGAQNKPKKSKGIETAGDTIKINFPEMDLESVLRNFSAITKKSFILEQMPKGKIQTIGPVGPVEVPKDEAFDLFVLILSLNGYNIVETSVTGVYKVVRSADALRENIPIYPPGSVPRINEAMVTRFIPLRYVTAQEISGQIAQLTSKDGGQVIAYQPTNTLIIVDTAINIDRMLKILRLLDVASPEPQIEIVTLKFATPGEVSGILSQIFQGSASPVPTRTASTKPTPRQRGKRAKVNPTAAQTARTARGKDSGLPKFIPVERINSLIILAERGTMGAILEFIAKLDIDIGGTGIIHVYYCQNAEASELAATLSGLAGQSRSITTPSARTSRSDSRRGRGADRRDAGRRTPERARTATPTRSSASSSVISGVLESDISITADEATNALIIVASPRDYEILKQVIAKLDIPRRQVFVEAVLLEVTYNESIEGGVSMHGASPLTEDGLVFAGSGFSDVNSMTLLSGILAGGGGLALPNGVTIGALGRGVEMPGTDGQVVIPSAGMIVRMLATDSNVNVLSTPTILTTDNEEASIEVGHKIPVPTGQTVSTGGFSNVSISRESVGIKLNITPQINESDNIRMEIFVEISGAVTSTLGIDVNTLGVTTSIKTAETTVIVKDSQTIVIGGLMEDREDESTSKFPFLGDIPILGWLFKTSHKGKTKTNLIILLTPHIVKSDSDIERVRYHMRDEYRSIVEESIGGTVPDREKYFESQLRKSFEGPAIDLRNEMPDTDEETLKWEWTPVTPSEEDGSTEEAAPSPPSGRSATTRDNREDESP